MADEKKTEGQEQTPDTPQPSAAEKAIAAFDEGVANPTAPLPPAKTDEEASEGDNEEIDDDEVGDGGDAGAGGEAPASGKPAAGAEGKSTAKKPDLTEEQKAAAKADADEADKLGLKDKARERFTTMSGTIREQAAEISQLRETFGIPKDMPAPQARQQIETLARAGRDQLLLDEQLVKIGATGQQFGDAMAIIAAFNSGDNGLLAKARENLAAWLGQIDAALGNETPFHDPLKEHADLAEKVKSGQMDKEDALEIARLRGVAKAKAAREQQEETATAAQREQQQAVSDLAALGAKLKSEDGDAVFAAKMAVIKPRLDADIRALGLHPSKWATYAERLYRETKAEPAARRPAPGKPPLRQQNATVGTTTSKTTPKDPYDAFDAGVAEAKAAGY